MEVTSQILIASQRSSTLGISQIPIIKSIIIPHMKIEINYFLLEIMYA